MSHKQIARYNEMRQGFLDSADAFLCPFCGTCMATDPLVWEQDDVVCNGAFCPAVFRMTRGEIRVSFSAERMKAILLVKARIPLHALNESLSSFGWMTLSDARMLYLVFAFDSLPLQSRQRFVASIFGES